MSVSVLKAAPAAPDEQLLAELGQLAGRLQTQQLWWASGYLAGLAAAAAPAAEMGLPVPGAAAVEAPAWTAYYASETGNSRAIAESLAERARALGATARAVDLAEVRPVRLKQEQRALFVVATHGLGDAPDGTEVFFEALAGERAPRLDGLQYRVLALGDSSYEDFCEIGRRLDARLAELGGERLGDRVDCDVDFEALSDAWQEDVLARIRSDAVHARAATGPHLVPLVNGHGAAAEQPRTWTRREPFHATVVENQTITGRGSSKTVRHVVVDLEDSGLTYLPGDALGVWPTNPPALVDAFLDTLGLDGGTPLTVDGEPMNLRDALAERRELTLLGRGFIERYAERYAVAPLTALLGDDRRAALNDYLGGRQIIDVLREHPRAMDAQGLVDSLRRLTPRLYSIASSLDTNPGEAHLTVAVVRYDAFGHPHHGSASNFLAEPGERVPVYVAPNPRFRVPVDPAAPAIMIGAGTGVAPYRAFLQAREAAGSGADNWLFFGDRNFASDFLYQVEWARYRQSGLLTRHDVAFSRDQAEKVYVQDRLRERGDELYAWLERGAQVYVCGDAEHMAPDVHEALLDVIEHGQGRGRDAAEAYLGELKRADRYQRDVY